MPLPLSLVADVLPLVLRAEEEGPKPEDVKAGYPALFLFLALIGAVALICWSLVHQLRKVEAARRAGVYGEPEPPEEGFPLAEPRTGTGPADPAAPADPTGRSGDA